MATLVGWRSAQTAWVTVLALMATACGSNDSGEICPECVAGGETSDFGTDAVPTACEMSEIGVPIDAARAAELGFAESLAPLSGSFTVPFAWTPAPGCDSRTLMDRGVSCYRGQPARGYSSPTTVAIETKVASIEHRVPQLDGCRDSAAVTIDLSMATADGAISFATQVSHLLERGQATYPFGRRLDVTAARGSLRLPPPVGPEPMVGVLDVRLSFWPGALRGEVWVGTFQGGYDSDGWQNPLVGRFPIDDCQASERPLEPAEPSVALFGKSALELLAMLEERQPAAGAWSDATWDVTSETSVNIDLGLPTSVCEGMESLGWLAGVDWGPWQRRASYEIPLRVTSGDGRVNMEGVEHLHTWIDELGVVGAWFDRTGGEALSQNFAAASGISNVDLRGFSKASWFTEIFLASREGNDSTVTIHGVAPDGTESRIERLSW